MSALVPISLQIVTETGQERRERKFEDSLSPSLARFVSRSKLEAETGKRKANLWALVLLIKVRNDDKKENCSFKDEMRSY